MKYLRLNSANHRKIWGTEEWIISAHPNGENYIRDTELTFRQYYREHQHQFGENLPPEFPLLVKIIDTFSDLSIQVHPGDNYAKKYENSLGKAECWYILEADDTEIIAGQKKTTPKQILSAIQEDNIIKLCNIQKIDKGDFFYIPAGCIHAIRKNTKLLEIQQSSDITYRLYDYNRRDENGNVRDLHVKQALDVIDYNYSNELKPRLLEDDVVNLVDNEFFYVDLYKKCNIKLEKSSLFRILIAIDGPMEVDGEIIFENEGIVLLANKSVEVKSPTKVIISSIKRGEQ